ncbi:hypothetical protein MUN89_19620 [Halobacillus salinarum]|uniref:Uncharacterized protein n=1 Tax=Halobacillus salinarum TaxID=2932257 RepID=A0ABY4EHY3_9BACI|nr:hypothetical protein [Halobacillus salinarum]UOQ44047.1 hypothetical protein MUN89_19620 [Halobacillus salinarum]
MSKLDTGFAVAGSILCIVFFMMTNLITSPDYIWFLYPSFAVLCWPITVIGIKKGGQKQLAYFYSAAIIVFLIVENYVQTPHYPWFLYAVFPILWWPILVSLGQKAKTLTTALAGSLSIILYYVILNLVLSSTYPWAVYPVFAVLWWPLSVYHAQRKTFFQFSIHGSLWITLFFSTVNAISTPHEIWAVYPIFCVLWWPLSMYYFSYKKNSRKA